MMNFKLWLEIAEPKNPKNVRKKTVILDQGTNVARNAIQYSFKTSAGNSVKVLFQPQGDDKYDIVFYVNNKLHDDAPENSNSGRDKEILGGVLHIVKSRAETLKAKIITFNAHKSDNDTKTIRGLDTEPYKKIATQQINTFEDEIKRHQVQEIPVTQNRIDLFKRLGKGYPTPIYDINKEKWLQWADQVKEGITREMDLSRWIYDMKAGDGLKGKLYSMNLKPLLDSLTAFSQAVLSNSDQGWLRTRNRRASIYKVMMQKHMSQDWDIEQKGNYFTLVKKDEF